MKKISRFLISVAIGGCCIAAAFAVSAAPDSGQDPALAGLHFRFLGPGGNRAVSIVGVPGDPNIVYIGAASGGIWKTTDGGLHFKPVFDSTDVSAVGALALAPSNPNVVWAGTGEPYIIREASSPGDGVYKSTDGGETWSHMGLEGTGRIDNIAIDPTNPNIVFVCAVGQVYKPGPERGVYRTEDGGETWKLVLTVNATTGCSGLSMDMQNPNTLFASTWQVLIRPWDLDSGGPDGGVFVTHDGGNTWSRLGAANGLPAKGTMIGKTAVRIAPSNDRVVYALMQSTTGLLYRSNDGGQHWTLVHKGDDVDLRAPYYTNFAVAPNNENLLYFPSTPFLVSHDGGRTITNVPRPTPALVAEHKMVYPGGDTHDVWIDPKNPNRIMTAQDIPGGEISLNGGRTWLEVNLPIAQIYHVDANNAIPYDVIGNRQDDDGEEGPSRVLYGGGFGGPAPIPPSAWHGYAGCESGFGVFDPVDPNIIWSSCYNGDLTRINTATGQAANVSVWPVATFGANPANVRDRWNWSFPIAISPFDHNRVYVGSQYVYETTDKGQSWKRISPDLTTGKHLGNSGGLTIDNLMTFQSASLSIIDESPVRQGVIWAGSYDGQVSVTQDGGAHWTNVTPNIKGMPPDGTINLQASPFDAGTAYVTENDKEMGNYNPYIFETTDYGKTWKSVSGNLPHSQFSYVHVVREDPVRKGMLYAGTENALYVSWDNGTHWTQLRNNFPPAPVYWLKIQPKFSDLLIATYGRGIWVLDDVTPLRSWDRVSEAKQAHLFSPRDAYRFRTSVLIPQRTYPDSAVDGENIPYGADLNYFLPAAGPVTLTFTSSGGKIVRTLNEKGSEGLNRIFWDLRDAPPNQALLLTNPPGKPSVNTPPTGRPIVVWGAPPRKGSLVIPGTFKVTLNYNGTQVGSAALQVLADPNSPETESQMMAQQALSEKIKGEINEVVRLVDHFERVRKKIETLTAGLGTDAKSAHVRSAADALEAKAVSIEGRLFAVNNAGESEDSFRMPPQLYAKLGSLYGDLVGGRYGTAYPGPTTQQVEVNNELAQTLASVQQETQKFNEVDVVEFNKLARANGLNGVLR